MTKLKDLHRRWSEDAEYRLAYELLEKEFELAKTLIGARKPTDISAAQSRREKDQKNS